MKNHLTSIQVQEYLDGDLSPVGRSTIDRHLRSCVACRSEVAAYRMIIAGAHGVGAGSGPRRGSWPGVESRIRRSERIRRLVRRAAIITILVVPAAVLAYGTGSLDTLLPPSAKTAASRPIAQEAEYRSIAAQLELDLQSHGKADPEVLAEIEREVAQLDDRIREVRRQLHRNPAAVLLLDEMVALHAKRIRTLDSGLWLLASG